jgi:uncharacterized protein YjbJ (UPF0337 family)
MVANITGGGQWADATGKAREMVGKMTLEEKVSKAVKKGCGIGRTDWG